MIRKEKILIIIGMVFLFAAVSGIFAQEAVIRELSGTVELKKSNSAAWEKAAQGQTVAADTVISTGFKSSAIIGIGDSLISVRPLTRLSITELSGRSGTETINLSLQSGRIRADVNAPSGGRTILGVQSPVATASVRGTIFEMGVHELRVIEGTVEYMSAFAVPVLVDSGGNSQVDEKTGRAVNPAASLIAALNPGLPIANDSFRPFEVEGAFGDDMVDFTFQIKY